nr:DNA polymerase/3'-5' exonuclease PolX [Bacteroidota bacterium]
MALSNRQVAKLFRLATQLLELYEANPFKIRSYEKVADLLIDLDEPVTAMAEKEIDKIKGIGDATMKKIVEITETGSFEELENMIGETPPGLLELIKIKGVGPGKARTIWKSIGVT